MKSVYFIRGEATGRIKIGVSDNVARRFNGLASQNADLLALLVVVPYGGTELEEYLHAKFASCRAHGEWFEPAPELLDLIAQLLRDDPPSYFKRYEEGGAEAPPPESEWPCPTCGWQIEPELADRDYVECWKCLKDALGVAA